MCFRWTSLAGGHCHGRKYEIRHGRRDCQISPKWRWGKASNPGRRGILSRWLSSPQRRLWSSAHARLYPSIDQAYLDRVSAARNGSPVPKDILPAGGADKFLDFLVHELRPFIEERYKVDPADQTLVGSSLGGLFGIYTYFRHSDAFTGYVINSPSLWWNNSEIMDLAERIALVPDTSTTMFVSVGGAEPNDAPSLMVDNFHRLVGCLGKIQGLELASHIFDGETHTSVIPAGLSRGLRTVFGPRP
ncbi:MAG: hypothetical protein CFE28_06260 [Alphaproteobacteria bacterium PA2]|nr:MAG: hypothetical protein CFE28_06260 [Alphaproteobacteria bacterium PA2]